MRVEIEDRNKKIVGELKESNKSKFLVILVHGFTGSKEGPESKMFPLTTKKLLENGFSVFTFDFVGSGESDGKFRDMTVGGEVQNLKTVISYMRQLGFQKIGLVGESLGGTISIKCSKYVDSIVLWYPAIILRETGLRERFLRQRKQEELKKNGFVLYKNSIGKIYEVGRNFINDIKTLNLEIDIAHVKIPTLLIHAEDDDIVDIKQSEYAFNILNCEKELEKIKTGRHGFYGTQEEAVNFTIDWFKKWLKNK